jgi:hypothetical protein
MLCLMGYCFGNFVKHPWHGQEVEDGEKHCVCSEVRSGTFILLRIVQPLFVHIRPPPLLDEHCLRCLNSYTSTFAEITF